MKIRMLFMIIVGILFVLGCGQETVNERHEIYLSEKGWEIKKSLEVETYILDIPDEILNNYEASGITFLRDYKDEEVIQHTYLLKEKDDNGERLQAVIFEVDKEIIGGYGVLRTWEPGIFNLDDQERLIKEQMIKYRK
ncbi:DUF4830 domain-containing protein [Psychrobacillus sp. MER TA 171]|uniref:DUF4830 domain-containing protein n=1 Tax=Psychrobacillus sp. MER TA 171 TaxID=2939577 RepID=UPI00204146B7|nr:DUF4830 domain-containing protein [Psychrobacillus sp. MER TA 171]MCM3357174.1 DUF4830 domain-containing protein [Psychrobacillus sp. MER TA 171]